MRCSWGQGRGGGGGGGECQEEKKEEFLKQSFRATEEKELE